MIVAALIIVGIAAIAFAVVVVGVQVTDHRMRLRDTCHGGFADAFARKVLGVYVRQATKRTGDENEPAQWQVRR